MPPLPLVSIGLPVYNGEDFIRQAIKSVINQDYPNIELVISDNTSTDNTQSICEEYTAEYSRIKYHRQPINQGMIANFNATLELAQGDFFCWLSHDDFLAPTYISKCMSMLDRHSQAIACCSEINFVNYDGTNREEWTKAYTNFDALNKDVVARVHELISKVGWYALYSVFRIDILKGMSKCQNRYPDDVMLMLEWLLFGEIAKVPEYLYNYRVPNIHKNHEDYIRAFGLDPVTADEVRKGSFTYTAREILNFVCKSSISIQDKYRIKEDFIHTLCYQNFDWLGRILKEQNFLITETTTSSEINKLLNELIISEQVATFFSLNTPIRTSTFTYDNEISEISHSCIAAVSKKPLIDVVLQSTGTHGWSASEGWVNTLKREGLLNRVFRPISSWGAEEPAYDDGLFEYLRNPQADIMILLGFDWHSQPLHNTTKWKERWQQSQVTKVAIIQECYSTEILKSSPSWQQQMYKSIISAASCVDALVCHHETDIEFLNKQLGISLPAIFLPFAVDTQYFIDQNLFTEKLNKALFRGNAPSFFASDSYKDRQRLMEILSHHQNVDLFPSNLFKDKQAVEIMEEYTSELSSYRIVLNLPSISSTLTARPFEIMACGGLLVQNKIVGEQSNALFQDWENIVYYDPTIPNDIVNKIDILIADEDLTKKISQNGYKLCREKHTIECRINSIVNWVIDLHLFRPINNNSLNNNEKIELSSLNSQEVLENPEISKFTIVVDGVFFQLYNTGIARVWKSVLEEWANNEFGKHIVVLDRNGTAPKIPGIRYCQIPIYDYNSTDTDREMLQKVCDDLGADLFISTYYTTPLETPSVFMGYDMIPEVLGFNLSEPMWQEKHKAIEHASAYITISHHTGKDLVKVYPEIDPNDVTTAHCGAQSIFKPATDAEIVAFRYRYGINKPYFTIGASGGYKNIELFLQAFAQLPTKSGFDIIVTGGHALSTKDRQYTVGSTVHCLQLDDRELSIAYSGAVALIYPSKYEGFGLPIVEAFASACPVITCRNASIPEVAGDAAIYVSDSDVLEMAGALCEVQKPQIRKSLIAMGLERVHQFSWTKMANIMQSVLIGQTLSHLQLKQQNLIIFPDWSADEELLGEELSEIFYQLAQHPDVNQMTLIIDTTGVADVEIANALISAIVMNIMMSEEVDITESLTISFTGELAPIQWIELLPKLQGRIKLERENLPVIDLSHPHLIREFQLAEVMNLAMV